MKAKRFVAMVALGVIFVLLVLTGAATAVYGAVNPEHERFPIDEETEFDPFNRILTMRAITPKGVCAAEIDYDNGRIVHLWLTTMGREPYRLGSSRRVLPLETLTNSNVESVLKEAVGVCVGLLRSKK